MEILFKGQLIETPNSIGFEFETLDCFPNYSDTIFVNISPYYYQLSEANRVHYVCEKFAGLVLHLQGFYSKRTIPIIEKDKIYQIPRILQSLIPPTNFHWDFDKPRNDLLIELAQAPQLID